MSGGATPATGVPATGAPPPRAPRPARPRALLCPQCGAPVTLRAGGSSVSAVCPACTAVLDVASDESLRLVAATQDRTHEPVLPIGSRGVLDGTAWEVVGFQLRSTGNGAWPWEEYLLFNPYQGFRFLLHDHADWSLFQLLRRDFPEGPHHTYTMGETETARTDYVLGEFYWRVRVGDEVRVREYSKPPSIMSEEWTGSERTWSEGRALDTVTVRDGFGLLHLPGRAAPAGAQYARGTWAAAAVACLLLAILAVGQWGQDRNQVVLRAAFEARSAGEQVVGEFTLPGAGGSLAMEASSAFTGAAPAVQLKLLPVDGSRGYTADMQLGGYFGDTAPPQQATFASVPGGQYRLAAEVDTPGFHPGPQDGGVPGTTPAADAPAAPAAVPVEVTLRRHPPSPGAVVVALLAILAWPVVRGLVRWARRQGAA